MKMLGLTLAAGLMLAVTASDSQAQVTIGNPYNGQGVTIGRNGVTPSGYGYNNGYTNNGYGYGNRYGYSPNGYSTGGYRVPGTNYYSSGYQAPVVVTPNGYQNGSSRGYGTSSYRYPMNYGRTYTRSGTAFGRGLLRRMRAR